MIWGLIPLALCPKAPTTRLLIGVGALLELAAVPGVDLLSHHSTLWSPALRGANLVTDALPWALARARRRGRDHRLRPVARRQHNLRRGRTGPLVGCRSMADSGARLTVLHGLRLKGFAETGPVAERAAVEHESCESQLASAEAEGLVVHREGRVSGWMLTPSGRAEVAKLLASELDLSAARGMIEEAYGRFLAVNVGFLALCTDWQMIDEQTLNDHSDPVYDGRIIGRLGELDDQVQPVCADLGTALGRLAGYGGRLAAARTKVENGDTDWFTKPMIESYHTVWFELHEDLLATLGIERSKEAS